MIPPLADHFILKRNKDRPFLFTKSHSGSHSLSYIFPFSCDKAIDNSSSCKTPYCQKSQMAADISLPPLFFNLLCEDCLFNRFYTFVSIPENIFAPETKDPPAKALQFFIDFLIPFHVAGYLLYPEFRAGAVFQLFFQTLIFPAVIISFISFTVKKLTVNKNTYLLPGQNDVWLSRDFIPVLPVAVSFMP